LTELDWPIRRVAFWPAQSGNNGLRSRRDRPTTILLADEPTGNLDTSTGDVIALLRRHRGWPTILLGDRSRIASVADRPRRFARRSHRR
jgi:predicted ABC-type transport system involved in lysophospholipase L1 biosynthesis ATPase subunit